MSRSMLNKLRTAGVVAVVLGLAACGQPTTSPSSAAEAPPVAVATAPVTDVAATDATLPADDIEAKVAKIRRDRKKAATEQAEDASATVSLAAATTSVNLPTPKATKKKAKKKASSLSAADRAYLSDLSGSDLGDEYTDAGLISFGHEVCHGYAQDLPTEAIYVSLQVVGFSQSDTVLMMSAGLNNYCPEYWGDATAKTSTTTTVVDGTPTYQNPQFNLGDITVPSTYEVRTPSN